MIREFPSVRVWWVTLSSSETRKREAEAAAAAFLSGAEHAEIVIHGFRDGFFPFLGLEIKEAFEDMKQVVAPDIVFTHYRSDAHQDHRLVSDLTWNTFRNHLILEYEIPKYDGDLGSPNFFVELARPDCERKIDHLMACYETQRDKGWFSTETFWGLLRLRGIEAASESGFAEGFYCRKLVV
jgi:LmbE family N-acetylglucosaminyl deacetylase